MEQQQHYHHPVNRRERISRKGWRQKDWRLIKMGEIPEWRSMRDGPHHAKRIAARAELAKARGNLRAYEKLTALALEAHSIKLVG